MICPLNLSSLIAESLETLFILGYGVDFPLFTAFYEKLLNTINPVALRLAKTLLSLGHFECNRVNKISNSIINFG